MPTLKNNFIGAKMNLDVDNRLLQKGEYRTANNIQVANSNTGKVGAIEKTLSTKQLTNLVLGENIYSIGSGADEFEEKLYWLVKSDSGSYLIEYDSKRDLTTFVLKDTREDNVLNLHKDYKVKNIIVIVDTNNNKRFIAYTDNYNQPRFINIERAKSFLENGFTEEDIVLIKKPPLYAPSIKLSNTVNNQENNIEERFLRFYTRFIYVDEERSAISPGSEIAFEAETFEFDYATASNESMINRFNQVEISFDTGGYLVKSVELLFLEVGETIPYLIERFDKSQKQWLDNTSYSVTFNNNKIYKTLSELQYFRLYDNVPLKAKSLLFAQNRFIFGNIEENQDIIDTDNQEIKIDLNLDYISTEILDFAPTKTNKSNRDYEVGLVYGEDYGRHTTTLTSENNTCFIPVAKSFNKNQLVLTIANQAPTFATWFRVCVKQNKYDFNIIVPTLFYEDGVYRWIKLEGNEKDKIKKGDYLLVKSDSQGQLNKTVRAKVLEIEQKDKNFLQPEDVTDEIKELSGLYFKIKPEFFRLDRSDYENYNLVTYHNARRRLHNPIKNSNDFDIGEAYFYGTGSQNEITTGGTYTWYGNTDIRFLVEITGTSEFRWSEDGGANWNENNTITANTPIALSRGVEITFPFDSGYELDDYWSIYARGKLTTSNSRAYGFSRITGDKNETLTSSGLTIEDEVIEPGARIDIRYDEWHIGDVDFTLNEISSRQYANIQEWFYGEEIADKIILKYPDFDLTGIFFMRGVIKDFGTDGAQYLEYDADGFMTMVFTSQFEQSATRWCRLRVTTDLFQSDGQNSVVMETDPKPIATDVFYQIGRTYPIVNNLHTSTFDGDVSQTENNAAVLKLNTYNAISWGNGFESIKIRDLLLGKEFSHKTKPNTPIENYKKNKKIATLRFGERYSSSLNYNGLNEFNLAKVNSKELDQRNGEIQHIDESFGDIDVYQEDKVSKVLYEKQMLLNQDGSSNISKSDVTLGTVIPYTGEIGISKFPRSHAKHNNNDYWVDANRGVVLRKGQSGIETISNFGMKNWFREHLSKAIDIVGGIDPHTKKYTLSIETETVIPTTTVTCGNIINKINVTEPFTYTFILNNLSGTIELPYNITSGFATIVATFNGENNTVENVTGSGVISFNRSSLQETDITVTITPISNSVSFQITNTCPLGTLSKIVHVVISNEKDIDTNITNILKSNSNTLEIPFTFTDNLVSFTTYEGIEGTNIFPLDGDTVEIQSFKNINNNGSFDKELGDRLGYLVSETEYNENSVQDLLDNATYPTVTTQSGGNANATETNTTSFVLNKPTTDSILYLIWDYSKFNTPPIAVDDSVSVNLGQSSVINVKNNDTDANEDPLTVIIDTNPTNGTVVVNPDNSVTYTHDGSSNLTDSFTYYLNDGTLDSNIATVSIIVGVSAGSSISASGSAGVYLVPFITGTEAGDLIIHFNAQSVPDRFQILFDTDGNSNNIEDMEVVADSLFVGDGISSSNPPNGTTSGLDLNQYNGSTFDTIETGTQSIVVTDDVVVVDTGNRTNANPNGGTRNGSYGTQIGVQDLVYTSVNDNTGATGLLYSDGNIALKFSKPVSNSYVAYIRTFGLNSTAWDIYKTEFIES